MTERDIFIAALQKDDPAQRQAFLDEACAEQPELRKQVDQLLRLYEEAGSFLQKPAAASATIGALSDAVEPTVPSGVPGAVIGPYKLVEQIGEGGMGTVWMAQQTEPVKRLVALKLIKAGMDSKQVIARFEAERQALALMDHPNIAKVLDAGAVGVDRSAGGSPAPHCEQADGSPAPTDARAGEPPALRGRPYFVMDLVKGVPITKYCDEHYLTPKQRLELFIPVCQAVQHAHQKGIIHRDLKPSNVLVALYDGKPVPKVIDFGVAKAAGQSLTDKTLVTGFGNIVGTLEYMSPEQAEINQLDIDTRSDIYSLGVLLYELLTGSPPFTRKELEKAGMLEMLRVIREQEPSKPSTKLSTAEGLPTLAANRGTEPAKLTKLVKGELDWIVMKALEKDRKRRYETANGFAMDVQRYLADEAVQACPPSVGYRLRKFARRNKSAVAVTGLVLLFLILLGSGAGWAVRDRAAREAELARERETRQAKISGHVELILGEVERLEREQKWEEALAAAKRAEAALASGEAEPGLHERVRQAVIALEMVCRLEDLRIEAMSGRLTAELREPAARKYAEAFHQYGINVEKLTIEEAAHSIRSRPVIAPVLTAALDFWAFVQGEDNAESRRLTAVAQAADPDPWRRRVRDMLLRKDWEALDQLAVSEEMLGQPPTTLYLLALALYDRGNHKREGEAVLRHAQRQYPSDFWINHILGLWLVTKEPPHVDEAISFMRAAVAVRPQYSWAVHNLGNALKRAGRLDEAIAALRKSVELDPNRVLFHANLGIALNTQGKLDEAAACHRKAIELDPKSATAHDHLGVALAKLGRLDEAVASHRRAIELDPKYATAHSNFGVSLKQQGKVDEAVASYRKAIELDPKLANPHNNLGTTLVSQGKLDEAITNFRKAIELEPKFAGAHRNLGNALVAQGKLDQAVVCYRKAIELDPKRAEFHSALAWLLATSSDSGLRNPAEAVRLAQRATELEPQYPLSPRTLGVAQYRAGDWKAAIGALEKSLALRKGGNSFDWFFLAMAHRQLGENEKARDWYDKAVQWMNKNQPNNEELRRFRAEAAELIGVEKKKH